MNLLQYLYWINIITFVIYAYDKHLAYYLKFRIPEVVLLFFAFIGGAFGALLSMWLFKHKTKHPKFTVSVPVFLIIQAFLVVYVIYILGLII